MIEKKPRRAKTLNKMNVKYQLQEDPTDKSHFTRPETRHEDMIFNHSNQMYDEQISTTNVYGDTSKINKSGRTKAKPTFERNALLFSDYTFSMTDNDSTVSDQVQRFPNTNFDKIRIATSG